MPRKTPETPPVKPARKKRSLLPEAAPEVVQAARAGADPVEAALATVTATGGERVLPLAQRIALKRSLRMYYDVQRLRMAAAGRTHHPSRGAGEKDGADARPPIDLDPADKQRMAGYSGNFAVFEAAIAKDIAEKLAAIPFFRDVCVPRREEWRGIGPMMYAVMLAEIDVTRQDNPSQLWRFAGLSVADCRRCPSCHAVLQERGDGYAHPRPKGGKADGRKADGAGEPKESKLPKCPNQSAILPETATRAAGCAEHPEKGEVRHYNLFLKTKLVGVMADNILKARRWTCLASGCAVKRMKADEDDGNEDGAEPESCWLHRDDEADCTLAKAILKAEHVTFTDSPLRKLYDQRRKVAATEDRWRSDAHRHRVAIRWMIKMFLLDWWKLQREYMGLPVGLSYQDAKLPDHNRRATGT